MCPSIHEKHARRAVASVASEAISNIEVMDQMYKARTVIQYTTDGESYFEVECPTRLTRVWITLRGQEVIVARGQEAIANCAVRMGDPTAKCKGPTFGLDATQYGMLLALGRDRRSGKGGPARTY